MVQLNIRFDINNLIETRVIFICDGNETKSIRSHNSITAFFLKLFGKVIDIEVDGNIYHINKNSFQNKLGAIPENQSPKEFISKALSTLRKEEEKNVSDKTVNSSKDPINGMKALMSEDNLTILNTLDNQALFIVSNSYYNTHFLDADETWRQVYDALRSFQLIKEKGKISQEEIDSYDAEGKAIQSIKDYYLSD